MNPKRKAIWDKSGGKCWYCGYDLPEKGWHADHFEPLGRQPDLIKHELQMDSEGWPTTIIHKERRPASHPERDNIDNLVPACQSCNTIKGMSSIEGFRDVIKKFIDSLNNYSNQYKFVKRYGLVKETPQSVIFWFERKTGGMMK